MKNKMRSTGAGLLALAGVALTSGCAETWNKAANRGGLIFSKPADYIVLSQSGGQIMDVYKLNNVIVSSPDNSDGWIFQDQEDNSINVGGDAKVIRLNSKNSDLWSKYHEYHMEFENQTYREKFNPAE